MLKSELKVITMRKLRVKAIINKTAFQVQTKGAFNQWVNAATHGDSFKIQYDSEELALAAIQRYKTSQAAAA